MRYPPRGSPVPGEHHVPWSTQPRLVSSDASPTRPECAVTMLLDEAWMKLQVATSPPVVVTHIPLGDVPPASACTATPTTSATVAVAPQFPITLGEEHHQ